MDPTLVISWMLLRLSWAYSLLVTTLGLPQWLAIFLSLSLAILFFYCLYDLFVHRNRGETVLIWLVIVLVIPLSTLLYLIIGRNAVRKAPIHNSAPAPIVPTSPDQQASASFSNTMQPAYDQGMQKKYILGTTTALGAVVATIALVAGVLGLAFFVFVIISYIQCMNDPKCM